MVLPIFVVAVLFFAPVLVSASIGDFALNEPEVESSPSPVKASLLQKGSSEQLDRRRNQSQSYLRRPSAEEQKKTDAVLSHSFPNLLQVSSCLRRRAPPD